MEKIVLSADVHPHKSSNKVWQETGRKLLHNICVKNISTLDFSARVSGRRYGDVGCARFWSKPHHVFCARETYSNSGSGGYLLSWQIKGAAHIEQHRSQIQLAPGEVAILDARSPMYVVFNRDVQRIVVRLPAKTVEDHLFPIVNARLLKLKPAGALSNVLMSHLFEISNVAHEMELSDLPVLGENICNLIKLIANRAGVGEISSREIRRQAVVQHLRMIACNPIASLESAAKQLNMSGRLLQKILQEMDSSFSDVIIEERLRCAARSLDPALLLSVSDVAYQSGFNDVSHFNHLFKRRFAMTPTEYRKNWSSLCAQQ